METGTVSLAALVGHCDGTGHKSSHDLQQAKTSWQREPQHVEGKGTRYARRFDVTNTVPEPFALERVYMRLSSYKNCGCG